MKDGHVPELLIVIVADPAAFVKFPPDPEYCVIILVKLEIFWVALIRVWDAVILPSVDPMKNIGCRKVDAVDVPMATDKI